MHIDRNEIGFMNDKGFLGHRLTTLAKGWHSLTANSPLYKGDGFLYFLLDRCLPISQRAFMRLQDSSGQLRTGVPTPATSWVVCA